MTLVIAGLLLRYLDGRYGPVEGGGFGGPFSGHGLVFSRDGFSYRLASNPGAQETFIAGLYNGGSHAVEVTSITPPTVPPDLVSDVRWSVYRVVPGGSSYGVNTPWRSFPATIPPHGTIRLLFTVHRPAWCGPGLQYDGTLQVNWKSLLSTHTTWTQALLGDPFRVC